jgi:hypothetical protein
MRIDTRQNASSRDTHAQRAAMLPLLLLTATTAFHPHLVPAPVTPGLTMQHPSLPLSRAPPPQALLPKWIVPIFFLPWGIQIGYAIEVSLGVNDGPFQKFVASDLFQKSGGRMRSVDRSAPPRVKRRRLAPEANRVVQGFSREYEQQEVELLWAALLKCYGSQQRALGAIRLNPQMINPSYSFCNTLIESRDALESVMGKAEALEVMELNPAVLQCGPSLQTLGASEIKSMARVRSAGNRIIPQEARAPAVAIFVAAIAFVVAANSQHGTDPDIAALVASLKPLIGGGVVGILAIVVYGVASTGRSDTVE